MEKLVYKRIFQLQEKIAPVISPYLVFSKEDILNIDKFIIQNSKVIFPLFKKLERYILDEDKSVSFSSSEIKIFNDIPLPEKLDLEKQLPVEIFRGMTLSDDKVNEILNKSKKTKIYFNPKKVDYSSWSTQKWVAKSFTKKNGKGTGIIFASNLDKKIKFIDINIFYVICENLLKYYKFLNKQNKISNLQKQILEIIKDNTVLFEYETLIFGKVKCDEVIKV